METFISEQEILNRIKLYKKANKGDKFFDIEAHYLNKKNEDDKRDDSSHNTNSNNNIPKK